MRRLSLTNLVALALGLAFLYAPIALYQRLQTRDPEASGLVGGP